MKKEIEIPEGYEAKIVGNKVVLVPKESEDERIRKAIGAAICGTTAENVLEANGVRLTDALTYLERQKEYIDDIRQYAYNKGLVDAEQKPEEWSEEDENVLKYLHELISFGFTEKFFDAQTAADMREWLNTRIKSTRQQPQVEWSEEDRNNLNRIAAIIVEGANVQNWWRKERLISKDEMQKLIDWLKSFRPQPKHEWSKEDEGLIDLAVAAVEDFYDKKNPIRVEIINFLRSLRPQPQRRDTYYDIIHDILATLKDMDFMKITPEHRVSLLNDIRVKCKNADECAAILDEPRWKPSEEQMRQLKSAANLDEFGPPRVTATRKQYPALESLYDELSKL